MEEVKRLTSAGEELFAESLRREKTDSEVIVEAQNAYREWATASKPLAWHWSISYSLPATVETSNYGKLNVESCVPGTPYCRFQLLHAMSGRAVCVKLTNIRAQHGVKECVCGVITEACMEQVFTLVMC